MGKSKHLIASLASLALAAGSAAAADMPLRAPVYRVPPPAWTWSGFYLGANSGYDFGLAPTTFDQTVAVNGVLAGTSIGNELTGLKGGFFGGGQAGYNWQLGRFVVGLEGDIQEISENRAAAVCSIAGCPIGSAITTATTQLPWFGTLRGRLGVTSDPASGRVLFYVTGGLAVGEIDADYTGGQVGLPIGAVDVKETRVGWTVGGGAEARLGQSNWTMKLEYLYMDLGDVSGSVSSCQGLACLNAVNVTNTATTHVTDQLVRLGLNYKFPPPH